MANISSKIEYADKVVSNFAEKLNNYNNEMKDNIKQIQNYIASLGTHWEGDLYNSFKTKMNNELLMLESQIQRGEKLKGQLDEYIRRFKAALDQLRKSGEK